MTKRLPHIGSRELVSFPDQGHEAVPAKVDTGADYSSVWASEIVERDGTLEFKLFGRGSSFFSDSLIFVTNYGITEVRNSFGHTEIRYTVKLRVKLGAKVIGVQFRLADRSRNRYPVLIGKQTLSSKFLVDVSVNNKLGHKKSQILVLNSVPSKSNEEFFKEVDAVSSSRVSTKFRTYDDLFVVIGGKSSIRLFGVDSCKPLRRYDLIYFKTHQKRMEFATLVAEYASMCNIIFIDSEVGQFRSYSKLSQYARLARHGLPVPLSVAFHMSRLDSMYDFIVRKLGVPFVLKDAAADKGESNFLVHNRAQYDEITNSFGDKDGYFIAQKFIANDGDYRCLVLDKKLRLIISRRRANESTHLNNTSTGGRAELIDGEKFSSSAVTTAIKSAIVLGRQVAGVDLMQSTKTGKWYILEVNNSPQIASGAFVHDKAKVFAEFLKEQSEK